MLKKRIFIVLALAAVLMFTGCGRLSRYNNDKNVLKQSTQGNEAVDNDANKNENVKDEKGQEQDGEENQDKTDKSKDTSSDKTGVPQKYQKDEEFLINGTAWKNIDFKNEDLYAAAYIGYQDLSNLDFYKENYLNGGSIETYNISGEEYYLIIPKSTDMKVQIYKLTIGEDKEELVHEFDKAVPFVVCCNVSDIFPDCRIEITTADGSKFTEFSPYISLKDGSVQIGDDGIDITKAE